MTYENRKLRAVDAALYDEDIKADIKAGKTQRSELVNFNDMGDAAKAVFTHSWDLIDRPRPKVGDTVRFREKHLKLCPQPPFDESAELQGTVVKINLTGYCFLLVDGWDYPIMAAPWNIITDPARPHAA